jgi:sortase (surface protein transpeptidase)
VKWRPKPSQVAVAIGFGVLLLGAVIELAPWYQAALWQASPEAARAERNAAAPTVVPIVPTNRTAVAPIAQTAPTAVRLRPTDAAPTPAPGAAAQQPGATIAPVLGTPIALDAQIAPPPTPTPSTSDLHVTSSAFAFDDPPQPGAHAHLDLAVSNPTDDVADQVVLAIPTTWLSGYHLENVSPSPVDGQQSNGTLRLTFDGPAPSQELNVKLDFVTTDEVIDSPTVTVTDGDGRSVGRAHPATQAPPASPGPIYSIDIPSLKLHAGVVPVDWEPPLFVVGQVRTSAWLTRGNSVLVGHVRGAAGYNIFIHLDQLEPGDEIIANSRGTPYNFVVTDKQQLPEDDLSPTEPTRAPRLTLMTCAGDWNPLTQDYSDRLWVIAQPSNQKQDQATPPPSQARPPQAAAQ